MTVLKFQGVVTFKDVPYLGGPETTDCPFIGDTDLIAEVERAFLAGRSLNKPVTVAIADERFEGDLWADHGSASYGEYTPGDPATLFLKNDGGPDSDRWSASDRGHQIIWVLMRHEDKPITMWIADEPFNTLD